MHTIKEYITQTIKELETYYFEYALTNLDYQRVWEASLEDLPTLMDKGSELFNTLVAKKLKGESIDTPRDTHTVLWNIEMDTQALMEISHRDGQARTCADIADLQGWDDLKKKAFDCIYSD